ncbi:peroxidase RIP1-like [Malania oleifera]|uniref:peroxidase RIP1-like n=1 Tax=Malania oleifera TaxID=397392 RepID=UPI0025ADBF7C|nr:peroxidase RIP1-like [Malania oleifera]
MLLSATFTNHELMKQVLRQSPSMVIPACAQLTPDFYEESCPSALPTVKMVVERAIQNEPRMGASLLRLHFHDCFVNGCDGSILLDDNPNFIGEKTAAPNLNSVRGFEVVDEMKEEVNLACNGNVVSCADILAIAARHSVQILGGPNYEVLLGRRDARTASLNDANNDIPPPSSSLPALLSNFQSHGLGLNDLVALSGAHTIGFARCTVFRARIYNDTNMDPQFAASLRNQCPINGGDGATHPLDPTAAIFDEAYFNGLLGLQGLLHSDQELFRGDPNGPTDGLVRLYSQNPDAFKQDFAASMIKMGNIKPLLGTDGEIRMNCRKIN